MIKLIDLVEIKSKKKFSSEDRIKMYLKYYKNLSPKEFKIKKQGKNIIINLS